MEQNKQIQTIDMAFIEKSERTDYSDGDIVLLHNIGELVQGENYLFNMIVVGYCAQGKAQMCINGTPHTATAGDVIVLPMRSVVEDVLVSPDIGLFGMGLSYETASKSVFINASAWDMYQYLARQPIVHIDPLGEQVIKAYFNLLSVKMESKDALYYKEVMQMLFGCLYYELCSVILPRLDGQPLPNGKTQGGALCKRFFHLLEEAQGCERSVAAFADRLCVTPKYLTTVVKEATGHTCIHWIHQYTLREIERQLKYTDHTVKEISARLGFPNLSFFGKFVKARLGASPTEYRKRLSKK